MPTSKIHLVFDHYLSQEPLTISLSLSEYRMKMLINQIPAPFKEQSHKVDAY
jgi:hypothetical protein